ncbi:MAG: Appr-1-p processing protein [Gemmatimonadales bacterium]|nr:Appr-1-p processing protein [Gemmatimonadales bacterium]NIN10456.1 Appr-1-p processing protein [Gemmatimonadales bacterium]NIN49248.1 Appr-1-p processing protein [Gemmatimonadales bacterium]NIP06712.1 Appr-1-p processing protein [Gemmatimonadales bacterium]NIR00043.1 Appr-1-p processing protein [Gemmatimonadales bacterium]
MAIRISVRQGDITTYEGDAITNAANNYLQLGAGVAGAIRRAGGPTIQEECDRHGPIRVGEAAITSAGNMAVRWVIHAAAMGDEPVSERSIRESTLASLQLAAENGVKRIAFPVLGSGVGGFGFERAATLMRDAIRESPDAEQMEEIVFFGFLPEHAATLERLMG